MDHHGVGGAIAGLEGSGHVILRKQGIEVQGKDGQHTGQHNGQLHLQEGDQTAGTQVPCRIFQLLINGVEGSLDHSQGEGQLHHRVGHDNQEADILLHVQVVIEYIPYAVGVEVGAVGIADQDGRQQPGEQHAVFHGHSPLLALVLEDVVDSNHHNDAGQCRRNGGHDEAEPDAANRSVITEQAGDTALPNLHLATVGQEFIILLTEEVDQRELIEGQGLGTNGRIVLEGEEDNHHHGGHVDDEKHVGINMCQHIGHGIGNLLLHQLGLGFADG